MDLSWVSKHKYEIAAFLLFVLAWGLRANVDGLPLTHPGNIKAADPMYHALAADIIVESERYGYLAPYLAQGYTNMIDPSPPLNYLATAAVSKIAGWPTWASMYLLVTLFEAFGALILFFLCSKMFDSKPIGLLAAGLYVIPFGVTEWWYGMYIGLWNNVGGFFFFYASLLLAYEYWKHQSRWAIFGLSLTVASAWLIHVAELFITAFAVAFVGLRLLWKVNPKKEKIVHGILLGSVPLLSVILFWPRYQELSTFLTAGSGAASSFFGWYFSILPTLPFYTSLSTFFVERTGYFVPGFVLLALALLGLAQILLNWRKYLPLLVSEAYLFCHLFVFPWFLSAYYFFVRQRMALPFVITPLAAYATYHLIVKVAAAKTKVPEMVMVLIVIGGAISLGLIQYQQFSSLKDEEIITPQLHNALRWIQQNTAHDAEFFFLTGSVQMADAYAKRVAFDLDIPEFIPVLEQTLNSQGQIIMTEFSRVGSAGNTEMAASALDEGSFFNYGRGTKRSPMQNITTFDYVFMGDIPRGPIDAVRAYNYLMSTHLIDTYGWTAVYFQDNYIILRNPKVNG